MLHGFISGMGMTATLSIANAFLGFKLFTPSIKLTSMVMDPSGNIYETPDACLKQN
jgi:hydrogenase/urease accessory protein HupE